MNIYCTYEEVSTVGLNFGCIMLIAGVRARHHQAANLMELLKRRMWTRLYNCKYAGASARPIRRHKLRKILRVRRETSDLDLSNFTSTSRQQI